MKRNLMKYMITLACLAMVAATSYTYMTGGIKVSNNVNGRELPIHSVETPEKKIALTFDTAWGSDDTKRILDILQKQDVHAAFFVTGQWVDKYPDDVKAIQAAGHDLGNHSENHKNMSQLTEEEKTRELLSVHKKVKALTGVKMNLFRAPYGDYDDEVILNAEENGYYTVLWNVDSMDWKDYGVKNILKTVLDSQDLKNGAIILCHNGAKYTADALEELIKGLKKKGYELVPVSQLIYKDNYHMDVTGRQIQD